MLISALDDEDGQNVEMAAKNLGTLRSPNAVPALEAVARAEGRGNREEPARIAAVEALSRIAAPSSVEVLQQLARKRGLLAMLGFGGKTKLRAAATIALRTVQAAMAARAVAV
jgi:HEAT repeat protein